MLSTQTGLARRYAKALFQFVVQTGRHEQTLLELKKFLEAWNTVGVFKAIMLSPALTRGDKLALVQELAPVFGLGVATTRLLRLLVRKGRMPILPQLVEIYAGLVDQFHGIERAEVQSALELDAQQRKQIEQALSSLVGKEVICTFKLEPSLIGGIKAHVGGLLLDGSIKGKLNRMRKLIRSSL